MSTAPHASGTSQFALDGRRSAQVAAPKCASRKSTADCRSNPARGDLRRAKVDDFGMSEHLTALRAAAVPAARDGVERLATSCLTTPARGTWSQIAIPRCANAAVPALKTRAALSTDSDFSSDGRTSAQDVALRHARPRLTVARCCERRRGDLRCPEVSTFALDFCGARQRG